MLVFFFVTTTIGSIWFESVSALTLGWARFLARTLPNIKWNWDLIAMGVVCIAVILLLGQLFLNWFTNKLAPTQGRDWHWPWRWTCCGLISVMIFFLVGMSVGGMAHQLGWLLTSSEPWYEEKGRRWRDFATMRQIELGFQLALEDEAGNVENVRRELWKSQNDYLQQMRSWPPMMQDFHLLIIAGDDGKVAGTIIFPRDANRRAIAGGCYTFEEKRCESVAASKLPELIRKHQTHLVAL